MDMVTTKTWTHHSQFVSNWQWRCRAGTAETSTRRGWGARGQRIDKARERSETRTNGLITPKPQDAPSPNEDWLDLDSLAVVEVTSEEKGYPVESALISGEMQESTSVLMAECAICLKRGDHTIPKKNKDKQKRTIHC
jgi:hypothetical protein